MVKLLVMHIVKPTGQFLIYLNGSMLINVL